MNCEINVNDATGLCKPAYPVKELGDALTKIASLATHTMLLETESTRPNDDNGLPGGVVLLNKDLPTIIIPDLHARLDFFLNVINRKDKSGETIFTKCKKKNLQIVCVGDGVHTENQGGAIWQEMQKEYAAEYKHHKCLDEEMGRSFGLMYLVMKMKIECPETFFFLKGNHENIKNENINGNRPFLKYSMESHLTTSYVMDFWGTGCLESMYNYEKNLPLVAVSNKFMIGHAEPATFFLYNDILNYRNNDDVIFKLTWTNNDQAEEDAVKRMLQYYCKGYGQGDTYYFGGHRPVKGLYKPRAGGLYIQFHNPLKENIVVIRANKSFSPLKDIVPSEDPAWVDHV